jgi:hypothetical protein
VARKFFSKKIFLDPSPAFLLTYKITLGISFLEHYKILLNFLSVRRRHSSQVSKKLTPSINFIQDYYSDRELVEAVAGCILWLHKIQTVELIRPKMPQLGSFWTHRMQILALL